MITGALRSVFEKMVKTVDEKERTRIMYGFEHGEAFDLFYEGLDKAFSGFAATAIPLFEKSISINPLNPHTYMYLVMMKEFTHDSNHNMKKLCVEWLRVAETVHNDVQIARARASLKYYESSFEEQKQMRQEVGNLLKLQARGL